MLTYRDEEKIEQLTEDLRAVRRKLSTLRERAQSIGGDINKAAADEMLIEYQLTCARHGKPIPRSWDDVPMEERPSYSELDDVDLSRWEDQQWPTANWPQI